MKHFKQFKKELFYFLIFFFKLESIFPSLQPFYFGKEIVLSFNNLRIDITFDTFYL